MISTIIMNYDRQEDKKLKEFLQSLLTESVSKNYSMQVVGGLLKITPKDVLSKVFLELEQETIVLDEDNMVYGDIQLYRHKDVEVSKKFRGRKISKKWVLGFLSYNSNEAIKLTKERKDNPPKERHREFESYNIDGSHCRACGRELRVCICK